MPLRFEKVVGAAEFLSPVQGFSKTVHLVEYRRDPLTGFWSRINVERSKRTKYSVEKVEINQFIEKSEKMCFFCPQNLEASTPKFIFGTGRIQVGEAKVFPNLFPFGEHHAVVALCESHFVFPSQFQPKLIADGVRASLRYFEEVLKLDPDAKFCTINWNYMPPAAASVVHPHFQILADKKPTSYLNLLLQKSKEYWDENHSNYWMDLMAEERRLGERLVWENESLSCMASFSPQANNELLLVFKKISSLLEIEEQDIEDFAQAACKVLKAYGEMGIDSFNMAFFPGAPGTDYYRLNVKFVSRPNLRHIYISDAGFMERLHYESVIETLPEQMASRFRAIFSGEGSQVF
jgi:UDPglucose--hexose-1-phosphate uridylyltransferase